MNSSSDNTKKKCLLKRLRLPALLLVILGTVSLLLSENGHDCGGTCPAHAPEPEVQILLPDLPARTVIATVDGYDITLGEVRRVRDGKLAALPPGAGIRDAALVELMIRRHWLSESARAQGIEETDAYRDALARFRDAPAADWMTATDIEQRALAETFIEREVIERMDIQPEDIEDMFGIFKQTLPEGTTLEDARPMFENRLKRQAVERYLRNAIDQLEVAFHADWLEHIKLQAEESADAGKTDEESL